MRSDAAGTRTNAAMGFGDLTHHGATLASCYIIAKAQNCRSEMDKVTLLSVFYVKLFYFFFHLNFHLFQIWGN